MLTKEKVQLEDILGTPISKEEAYAIICSSETALELFRELDDEHQEEILAFIQGVKGLPILYDCFYKYVLDPEVNPERLESFLSDVLKQKVIIEKVIPHEGIHLIEAGSFVVMDIIVRLEDGSIVDVELQKQGYLFPGERSECYLSDMIMRQYNRVRREKGKRFKYSDIKPVYLIILMQNSSKEFRAVSPYYIHRVSHEVDSGARINFLTNLVYISLDTFHEVSQNIGSNTEAWLTFLSSDKPEDILRLVQAYPEFIECYRDLMEFRTRPEELMSMFSKALYEMDRNTEKYMVEEMKKEADELKKEVDDLKRETDDLKRETDDLKRETDDLKRETDDLKRETDDLKKEAEAKDAKLAEKDNEIEVLQEEIRKLKESIK